MNRRDSFILFIILILIFIGYVYPLLYDLNDQEPVTIFVIDTFDDSLLSHGDVVANIIEQEVPQFEIKRLNVKEKDSYGRNIYYEALDQVYNYKMENFDKKVIVNISLGFYQPEKYHKFLVEELSNLGVGIVAAAGNDDSPISFYPAAYEDQVVAVASIRGSKKTDYSNYGDYIDVCAEGRFFTSFNLPQFFSYKASGTSFAAPRVSAFLAKIISVEKDIDFNTALKRLNKLSVPLDDELYEKGLLGSGKISNFKYLINYNKAKIFHYYLIPIIIFLLMFYLLIKKLGLIAVPYTVLLVIVLGPFFIFLRDHFLSTLTKQIFTLNNFKLLALFVTFYLLAKLITSFEKYFLLKAYLLTNIVISAVLFLLNSLNLYNFIIFNIILLILSYYIELYIYKRKKDSVKINDLDSYVLKVVNKVKNNIINNRHINQKDGIKNLFKLYRATKKIQTKKAIIDILITKDIDIPFSFLFENTRSYAIKKYIFGIISNNKDKVDIEELFKILEYDAGYLEEIFRGYSFNEIKTKLKKKFKTKDIKLSKLIKVVDYYNERSINEFLISIYDDYQKCWHRYLLAKTILRLADHKRREELIKKLLKDKCGMVVEEAQYYLRKRRNP